MAIIAHFVCLKSQFSFAHIDLFPAQSIWPRAAYSRTSSPQVLPVSRRSLDYCHYYSNCNSSIPPGTRQTGYNAMGGRDYTARTYARPPLVLRCQASIPNMLLGDVEQDLPVTGICLRMVTSRTCPWYLLWSRLVKGYPKFLLSWEQ